MAGLEAVSSRLTGAWFFGFGALSSDFLKFNWDLAPEDECPRWATANLVSEYISRMLVKYSNSFWSTEGPVPSSARVLQLLTSAREWAVVASEGQLTLHFS